MDPDSDTSSTLPLVSIVVPVYNGELYLAESLDSIIAQTYPNVEILVMDDASTDDTANIIKSYGNKLTCYKNETNLGQFGNVNRGIEKTKGEFICVYHADDIYKPEIVAQEAQYLRENETAGAVFCLDIFIDAMGKIYNQLKIPNIVRGGGPFDYVTLLNALLTYKNVFLVGPTSMVRKSVYFDIGMYNGDDYGIYADFEMWSRIMKSYDLGIIEEHLHYYRHGHGNVTNNFHRLRTVPETYFKIMQNHLDEGDLALVKPDSLKAHKGHWTEELLMLSVNLYIENDLKTCKQRLAQVKLKELFGSSHIQRFRLFILYILLMAICRIPRISSIAKLFRKRWHNSNNSD